MVFIFIALGIGSLLQVFQEATDDLAQHYETQEETIEKLLEVAEVIPASEKSITHLPQVL